MPNLPDFEDVTSGEKRTALSRAVVFALGIFFFAVLLFIGIVIAAVRFASK